MSQMKCTVVDVNFSTDFIIKKVRFIYKYCSGNKYTEFNLIQKHGSQIVPNKITYCCVRNCRKVTEYNVIKV